MDKTNNTPAGDGGALKAVLDILCDQSIPHLAVRMNDACKYIDAALSASTEAALPTNEELERLWDQHSGHPADFGAAVLEKWGNWPAGMLGQGGTLASTEAAAVEPIHQWRTHFGDEVWQDVPADQFEGIGPSFRRIVYAAPPAASGQKLTELLEAAEDVMRNGHQHDVGGGDVFLGTCDSTERLQRAIDACRASSATASDKESQ